MRILGIPRALLNLLMAGFTLRYLQLDRFSLWLDEGATWAWTQKASWSETALAEANHPPLWWLVTRAWVEVFGDGEDALRTPAALCGLVTIVLAWLLGRRLFVPSKQPRRGGFARVGDEAAGERMALWFAGFVAGSAFLIEISQEARMYALLVAQSLGLALLYLRWLDRGGRAPLVGYAVLAALALYTQYFALWPILALAAHGALLAWRTRAAPQAERVPLLPFLVAHLAAAAAFAPWLVHLFGRFTGLHQQSYDALAHMGVFLWRVGIGPGVAFVDAGRAGAPISSYVGTEGPLVFATVALWAPFVLLGAFAVARRPGVRSLVACVLLVPLGGVLALLPWFTLVHERYLVFLAPWLWFLAVLGAWSMGRFKAVGLGALVLLTIIGIAAYHGPSGDMEREADGPMFGGFLPPTAIVPLHDDPARFLHKGTPFGKEPWREAAQFVNAWSSDKDLVLLHPGYVSLVWDYYGRRRPTGALETHSIPGDVPDEETLLAELRPLLVGRERVFLVISHAPTLTPLEVYQRLFKVLGALWHEQGAKGIESVPPIAFRRSWGVHVAMFGRK